MLNYDEMKENVKNIARKYSMLTSMDAEDMEQNLWLRFYTKVDLYENAAVATKDMVNYAIDLYRADRAKNNKAFSYDFSSSLFDVMQDNAEDSEINNKLRSNTDDYLNFEFVETMQKMLNEFKVSSTDSKREADRKMRAYKYIVCKGYLDCGIKFFENDCLEILRTEIPSECERREFLNDENCGTDDSILKRILHIQTGSNSGSIRKMKWVDLANFRLALMDMVASN